MIMLVALSLFVAGTFPTMAQNSFPTPGGAFVPGLVQLCYLAGQAQPCSGTFTSSAGSSFPTPNHSRAPGMVRMCIVNNLAVPC